MSTRPIGIYDSGIGGLTVLQALQEKLPHESFVYFADTAHLPYGTKSAAEIIQYSHDIVSWFQNDLGAKLVIAACHTSSALALEHIAPSFSIPLIGTIYPLLPALQGSSQRVGLIATPASVKSRMHETIFRAYGFTGEFVPIACPEFVPLIEATPTDRHAIRQYAEHYLQAFETHQLDTLLYGCTHYPFIHTIIQELLPTTTRYLNPARFIADKAYQTLLEHEQLSKADFGSVQYYCSQTPEILETKLMALLGKTVKVALQEMSGVMA